MTATRRDERIASLIDEHGFEGYGLFWAVLEIIAEQMPRGEARYEVQYSLKRWGQLLGCHHNKVKKYLSLLGVHGLVKVTSTEGLIIVSAPNLMKYRDEYSKKSGHTPESRRRGSLSEIELETEREQDGDRLSVCVEKILRTDGRTYMPCGKPIAIEQGTSPRPFCIEHLELRQRIGAHLSNGHAS
jgi:hypothetical protein